jgi:formiminotetrahydrofolate cyclodeaminase
MTHAHTVDSPRPAKCRAKPKSSNRPAKARQSSEIPLAVIRECARVIYEIEAMSGRSNLNAASDLEVAARLAAAAARGAAANVMINLPMVGDESYTDDTMREADRLLENLERATAAVTERVRAGSLREPEPA